MAGVTEGFIKYLSATAGVTAITNRIYASNAPQNTATPYVIIERRGGEGQYHSAGYSGITESQVTITNYGSTNLEAITLTEAIRVALNAKAVGAFGELDARRMTIDDTRDAYREPTGEGDEVGHPAQEMIVTVWHHET